MNTQKNNETDRLLEILVKLEHQLAILDNLMSNADENSLKKYRKTITHAVKKSHYLLRNAFLLLQQKE